ENCSTDPIFPGISAPSASLKDSFSPCSSPGISAVQQTFPAGNQKRGGFLVFPIVGKGSGKAVQILKQHIENIQDHNRYGKQSPLRAFPQCCRTQIKSPKP